MPLPPRFRRRVATCSPALLPLCTALALGVAGVAHAGPTINFDDGESVSIGAGIRTSFTTTTDAAPNGTDSSKDFNLDSIRLFINGTITPVFGFTFNTERNSAGQIVVLDAFAKIEPSPEFNIWAGRLLPPSDRANLDGPYYAQTYTYPGVVSNYYSLSIGRDDGVVAWGKVADKAVVYSVGIMQGRNHSAGIGNTTSNQSANLLYAGRVAVNFWDPEPAPAYFTGSTYFGAADIFTVAVAGQYQSDGVGDVTTRANYEAYNVDFLLEKKFVPGVLDVEGAYYKYNFSAAANAVDVSGGAGPGKAYLLGAAWLFPDAVGPGKFQPFARYQKFDADTLSGASSSFKETELGVHYVVKGPNLRFTAEWIHNQSDTTPSSSTLLAGLQFQF